jgi:hypothetical protein
MLLIQERWRSHSSFNDGRWTFHMGRAIRKYAVVRNLENPTAAPDRRGKRQQGIYGGWGVSVRAWVTTVEDLRLAAVDEPHR